MCVFPTRIEILAYILHDIDHGHKNMIFATKDGAVFKGNMHEDDWKYHFYDTVKGADWLGDQNAI